MADENKSEEEKLAEEEAARYFRENHPEHEEGRNIYENVITESKPNETHVETHNKPHEGMTDEQKLATTIGGVSGGYMAHKNTFGNLFRPGAGVYEPIKVEPRKIRPPSSSPARVPPAPPTPPSSLYEFSSNTPYIDDYDSKVDEVMKSLREKDEATGKQKRTGHNMEAQREKWELAENLEKNPHAKKPIVQFGPAYPTESGIIVSEAEGRKLEEEKLRKQAQQKIAEEQIKHEREYQEALRKYQQDLASHHAATEAEKRAIAEQESFKLAEQRAAQEAEKTGKLIGYGKGALRVGTGVLGGALAAKDAYDLSKKPRSEWTDEDWGKAISAGGGALMTVPTLPTEVLGGLATVGGMAYPYVAPHVRKMFR